MDLVVTREFADPDQIAAWLGPVGFSVPRDTVDMDVRVGGRTLLTLTQGPFPAEIEAQAREGWGSSFTKLDALPGG